ncbi:MAG: hypothetical protein DMG58_23535 [Acidobacteria bacterium]|nr:MAG: hypothetical protein DMG58_23535 [Acidobacteriota bacterium]
MNIIQDFYLERPWLRVDANTQILLSAAGASPTVESLGEAADRLGSALAIHPSYESAYSEYLLLNPEVEESEALMYHFFEQHKVVEEAHEIEFLRAELKGVHLRDGYLLHKLDLPTLRATSQAVRETRRLQAAPSDELKAAIQGQRKSWERTLPQDWLIPGTQTVLKLDRENLLRTARTNFPVFKTLYTVFGSTLIDARLRGEG